MRRFSLLLLAAALIASADDLKLYPGAKLDSKASADASSATPGKQSEVYTTADPLDKVYAFYKDKYKEVTMGSGGPKLPSGQQVKWYFFILDGGTTLANSKYWMKIQHPYVGGADGKDVRDITVIQTVRSK
jgi:hypothetical protein